MILIQSTVSSGQSLVTSVFVYRKNIQVRQWLINSQCCNYAFLIYILQLVSALWLVILYFLKLWSVSAHTLTKKLWIINIDRNWSSMLRESSTLQFTPNNVGCKLVAAEAFTWNPKSGARNKLIPIYWTTYWPVKRCKLFQV